MTDRPVPLSGGNVSGAARSAAGVHRDAGAWTPTVHRLLAHLRDRNIDFAPAPLGMDTDGREVVSFLPGEVPAYPFPAYVWGRTVLADAATMLVKIHAATSDFDTVGAEWRLPTHSPAEVVCHNDFAPHNMVFADGRLTGIIDWDTASPGPRVWDLAYLAYRLVPLTDRARDHDDGFTDGERSQRVLELTRAYGHGVTVEEVLRVLPSRLRELADFAAANSEPGDPMRDHAGWYRHDAERIERLR